MNLLRQQQQQQPRGEPPRPPMYMMVPIEEKERVSTIKKRPFDKSTMRSVKRVRKTAECVSPKHKEERASDVKFPEMRSGILFTRCYCVHRDGMQDSCPLTQCQGKPECLVKPWPICPPGKFLRSRHPELYLTPANPDSITY